MKLELQKIDREKLLKFMREDLRQFIEKNKTLVILIGVLLAVLIMAVALQVKQAKEAPLTTVPGKSDLSKSDIDAQAEPNLTILPETMRTTTDGEAQGDPFAGPMTLKGILLSGGTGDTAIIEIGNTTYVVRKGDSLGGLWTVEAIRKNSVILFGEDQTTTLEFSGRVRTDRVKTEDKTSQNNTKEDAKVSAETKGNQPQPGAGEEVKKE